MYYLVYSSHAADAYEEKFLEQMLFQCQTNNSQIGVTGLLLYSNKKFIQVLEGKQDVVQRLFEKIQNDDRHYNVKLLIEGFIKERNYPEWNMGYKSLFPEEVMSKLGYRDPEQYFTNNEIKDDSHVTALFMRLFFDRHFNSPLPG